MEPYGQSLSAPRLKKAYSTISGGSEYQDAEYTYNVASQVTKLRFWAAANERGVLLAMFLLTVHISKNVRNKFKIHIYPLMNYQ